SFLLCTPCSLAHLSPVPSFPSPRSSYLTFATGTPVANSLAELFVMQTYLRPDLLAHAVVANIDAWGQNFTDTTETGELNAAGTRSEEHTSELQSRFDIVCRLLLEKNKQY